MAEKLSNFPQILDLLGDHEIGYHSSSHSVRPTIFEYTDVKNYEAAYLTSMERETAHINPLTGEIEGEGGILFLRDIFPNKNILSFRAPGCCWSPPHLESLVKLGIKFDFSANISPWPVYFKGITFYPYPVILGRFHPSVYSETLSSILKNEVTVLFAHPFLFVNRIAWDTIYHKGNPEKLFKVPQRSREETEFMFLKFELLLKQIKLFQRTKLLQATPYLRRSRKDLKITKIGIQKCCETSMTWPIKVFDYQPTFLRSHFFNYFR